MHAVADKAMSRVDTVIADCENTGLRCLHKWEHIIAWRLWQSNGRRLQGPSEALTAVRRWPPLSASCEVDGLIFVSLVLDRLAFGALTSRDGWTDPALVAGWGDPSPPGDVNKGVLAADVRCFTAS